MSEWISVKDRLPEIGETILAAEDDYLAIQSRALYEGGWFWSARDDALSNPTHWMPLPDPPENAKDSRRMET